MALGLVNCQGKCVCACPAIPRCSKKAMKLSSPPKGASARGICVSLTLAFPKSGVTTVRLVLFLPDVAVLGANPFWVSSLEQNDLFLSQLFGITKPARGEQYRSHRGFNLFAVGDLSVLLAIRRGEYHLGELSNRLLQRVPSWKNEGQISRILKRLRLHGLIRKIGQTLNHSRIRESSLPIQD